MVAQPSPGIKHLTVTSFLIPAGALPPCPLLVETHPHWLGSNGYCGCWGRGPFVITATSNWFSTHQHQTTVPSKPLVQQKDGMITSHHAAPLQSSYVIVSLTQQAQPRREDRDPGPDRSPVTTSSVHLRQTGPSCVPALLPAVAFIHFSTTANDSWVM